MVGSIHKSRLNGTNLRVAVKSNSKRSMTQVQDVEPKKCMQRSDCSCPRDKRANRLYGHDPPLNSHTNNNQQSHLPQRSSRFSQIITSLLIELEI